MSIISKRLCVWAAAIAAGVLAPLAVHVWAQQAAQGRGGPTPPAPTLGLENGTLDFDTPDFTLKLVKDSQTIAALQPKGAKGMDASTPFDFTPADQLTARQGDRFNHLGDIHLRDAAGRLARRRVGRSRVEHRAQAGDAASPNYRGAAGIEACSRAADLTPTMGESPLADHPRRGCSTRPAGWCCTSTSRTRARRRSTIGGLGFPVVFNNMIQNFVTNRARTLPQAHEICSFFDPYVGRDAGYLQVTRLSGAGPALVVTPQPGTKTPFEAFRPLNDASRRGQTFEGAFEWTVHSSALRGRTNGRASSSGTRRRRSTLAAGRVARYGLRLLVSDEIREHREDAGRQRSARRRRHSRLHRADGSRREAVPARRASGRSRAWRVEPAGALAVTAGRADEERPAAVRRAAARSGAARA